MEINGKTRRRVAENLRKQLIAMRKNDSYEKDVDVAECGNTTYRNIAWAVEPYGNLKKAITSISSNFLSTSLTARRAAILAVRRGPTGEHHDFFCRFTMLGNSKFAKAVNCPRCGTEVESE